MREMTLRSRTRNILTFLLISRFSADALALGVGTSTRPQNKSDNIVLLIFFGAVFLVSGLMSVKNRKCGPEEGMGNLYLKGEKAKFWGYVQLFCGLILIVVSLAMYASR